jgi:hypothetical protein
MAEKEPTQRTEKGHEIPIPRREDFMRDLKKAAKVPKSKTPRRPKKN